MAISFVGATTNSGSNPTSGIWTLPAGWKAKDLALCWWYSRSSLKNITEPAAVSELLDQAAGIGGNLFVGYRRLLAADVEFTWTANSVNSQTTVWGLSLFRNINRVGSPIDDSDLDTFANTAGGNIPLGEVTPVADDSVVFVIYGRNNDTPSLTPPPNYLSAGAVSSEDGSDASAAAAYRILTGGAGIEQDPGAFTTNSTSDDGLTWVAVLGPHLVTGKPKIVAGEVYMPGFRVADNAILKGAD